MVEITEEEEETIAISEAAIEATNRKKFLKRRSKIRSRQRWNVFLVEERKRDKKSVV